MFSENIFRNLICRTLDTKLSLVRVIYIKSCDVIKSHDVTFTQPSFVGATMGHMKKTKPLTIYWDLSFRKISAFITVHFVFRKILRYVVEQKKTVTLLSAVRLKYIEIYQKLVIGNQMNGLFSSLDKLRQIDCVFRGKGDFKEGNSPTSTSLISSVAMLVLESFFEFIYLVKFIFLNTQKMILSLATNFKERWKAQTKWKWK